MAEKNESSTVDLQTAMMALEDLKTQLEDAQQLAEERLDQLLRCRAELDNVVKRSSREKEEMAKYASEKLICKILPVLDSLEQAAKHDEGSKILYQQLFEVLRGEGLVPIEAVGKKFDPYRHEALYKIKSEQLEEDAVAEEVQKGYLFGSRVIRFSKVAVAKR
ncbi:MAG: nucleotide exchange factor GrpE [Methanotrichaceae archaeon]|nr:nucleotide exchange factor GrpE [Methanotrichaceae archaeon]